MAFGKAIAAETLDLLEAALGELGGIAARGHAFDQLGPEIVHRADIAEGRHRAAQLVGFRGREIRRNDRELHRLFLEQRHAIGLAEQVLELVGIVRRRGRGYSTGSIPERRRR